MEQSVKSELLEISERPTLRHLYLLSANAWVELRQPGQKIIKIFHCLSSVSPSFDIEHHCVTHSGFNSQGCLEILLLEILQMKHFNLPFYFINYIQQRCLILTTLKRYMC